MRAASRLGLLLLAVVFLAIVPTVAGAEDTVAFTIKDARITESSGLAVDPAGNLYWTVNDSGDRGVAYGIGLDGKVQGTLNFRAQPAMSRPSRCTRTGSILPTSATTAAQRNFVRVYFFTNPRANGLTVTYHAYDFRYPDGPHNAETLLVDDSGRLFIVTKGQEGCHIRGSGQTGPSRRQRARAGRLGAVQCHRRDLPARRRQDRSADLQLGGGPRRDQLRGHGQRSHPRSAAGGVADPQPGQGVPAGWQRGQEVQGLLHAGAQRGNPDAHAWAAQIQAPRPTYPRSRPPPARASRERCWPSGWLASWRWLPGPLSPSPATVLIQLLAIPDARS